eukprot:TRINITY_DN10336_c0_g1_i1.p1 TRINITY_DN10336_c0_g1~~TRINITY_DN10336_c0_g1_i1.p1  ORF type:complete len:152 (+),score=42.04 TRINITY_DN10336_c0_g1_i1:68-523(+)
MTDAIPPSAGNSYVEKAIENMETEQSEMKKSIRTKAGPATVCGNEVDVIVQSFANCFVITVTMLPAAGIIVECSADGIKEDPSGTYSVNTLLGPEAPLGQVIGRQLIEETTKICSKKIILHLGMKKELLDGDNTTTAIRETLEAVRQYKMW